MSDPLQQARNHFISLDEAAEMTRRHRNQATVSGLRQAEEGSLGGMFSRDAILALLARKDAAFLRYYHARDAQGKRTIVLCAADARGNDLLGATNGGRGGVGGDVVAAGAASAQLIDGGQALDQHWPCPPFCPPDNTLLRG